MSFILNWISSFWAKLFGGKSGKLLLLGLDSAGKTTMLGVLKDDKLRSATPTFHPQNEELTVAGVSFRAFDLGGHLAARKIWRDYFADLSGIVFMVDAANPERFEEARTELQSLLSDDEISQVPVAVVGNKIDKRAAVSEQQFRAELALTASMTTGMETSKANLERENIRPCEVFMCSVTRRAGHTKAFKWIAQYM